MFMESIVDDGKSLPDGEGVNDGDIEEEINASVEGGEEVALTGRHITGGFMQSKNVDSGHHLAAAHPEEGARINATAYDGKREVVRELGLGLSVAGGSVGHTPLDETIALNHPKSGDKPDDRPGPAVTDSEPDGVPMSLNIAGIAGESPETFKRGTVEERGISLDLNGIGDGDGNSKDKKEGEKEEGKERAKTRNKVAEKMGTQGAFGSLGVPGALETRGMVEKKTYRGTNDGRPGQVDDDIANSGFYNLKAEKEVLGCLLFDNNNLNHVGDFLLPLHFYEPLNGRIYDTIVTLINKGKVGEPQSLENHFNNDPAYKLVGGAQYLYDLYGNYAIISAGLFNTETKGKLILDLYLKRKLLWIIQESRNLILEDREIMTGEECIERVEKNLYDLSENLDDFGSKGFTHIEKSVGSFINRMDEIKARGGQAGISTGFNDLDRLLSGWQKSDLVIIAGRPSMGKTAFAVSLALNSARHLQSDNSPSGGPGSVGIISLEMSAEQLSMRVLSMYSEFSSDELAGGKFDQADIPKIAKASREFSSLPIYIDDTPSATIGNIRTRARRLKKQANLSILIIDYLQLLRSGTANRGSDGRVQEVSEITRGLKALAKELDIPVIALAQLSRNVESREDKRPQLQDLRESGSIEQDADIVMFVYREAYYLARTKPDDSNVELMNKWNDQYGERWHDTRDKSEIIVGKHRNGPIGTITLRFNQSTTRFENLDDKKTGDRGVGVRHAGVAEADSF